MAGSTSIVGTSAAGIAFVGMIHVPAQSDLETPNTVHTRVTDFLAFAGLLRAVGARHNVCRRVIVGQSHGESDEGDEKDKEVR